MIRWVNGLCQWGLGSVTKKKKKKNDRGRLNGFLLDPVLLSWHIVTICAFTAVQIHSHCSHSAQSAEHFCPVYPGKRKERTIARCLNISLGFKLHTRTIGSKSFTAVGLTPICCLKVLKVVYEGILGPIWGFASVFKFMHLSYLRLQSSFYCTLDPFQFL